MRLWTIRVLDRRGAIESSAVVVVRKGFEISPRQSLVTMWDRPYDVQRECDLVGVLLLVTWLRYFLAGPDSIDQYRH